MLTIDGSRGEGGGQILRTALALSLVTRTPFRMERVRAGRPKPGLRLQHLAAVRAAAQVGRARVGGDEVGSQELVFEPGDVQPGHHRFEIGSAGSATLVLQTLVPALLRASGPSTIEVLGGTHNPFAPTFEFFRDAYCAALAKVGPRLDARLHRWGFYPRGGGHLEVSVHPAPVRRLELLERGRSMGRSARATVLGLPAHIAEREAAVLAERLGWPAGEIHVDASQTPAFGNYVTIRLAFEHVTEVFTAIGERGKPAERVAEEAAHEAADYLASDVPVGPHLADQLLLPMALGEGGTFRTLSPTLHTRTQADTIALFLPAEVTLVEEPSRAWRVTVARR